MLGFGLPCLALRATRCISPQCHKPVALVQGELVDRGDELGSGAAKPGKADPLFGLEEKLLQPLSESTASIVPGRAGEKSPAFLVARSA